jgi:hypothetical protein
MGTATEYERYSPFRLARKTHVKFAIETLFHLLHALPHPLQVTVPRQCNKSSSCARERVEMTAQDAQRFQSACRYNCGLRTTGRASSRRIHIRRVSKTGGGIIGKLEFG